MTRERPITIGISTCPNDTFAFAALLEKRVSGPAFEFVLDDVQALNERLMRGELDVAKASFHAALQMAKDYCVLPVGAALGYGVGPLLLAARTRTPEARPGPKDRVLCPGQWTTASLLYRLFYSEGPEPEHVVFSEIMPALSDGEADYGVVIHEGRFTYQELGLHCVADLGATWERDTASPLPLGGILARNDLGDELLMSITEAIRASLRCAKASPDSALPQMARYAQEMSDEVLWEHVMLYVNEATENIGSEGLHALGMLEERARSAGVLTAVGHLDVFGMGGGVSSR